MRAITPINSANTAVILRNAPEKEGPFGWAKRAQPSRLVHCPPWSCTESVQWGSMGETHTYVWPWAQLYASLHMPSGASVREYHRGQWKDSWEAKRSFCASPNQLISAEQLGDEILTHITVNNRQKTISSKMCQPNTKQLGTLLWINFSHTFQTLECYLMQWNSYICVCKYVGK